SLSTNCRAISSSGGRAAITLSRVACSTVCARTASGAPASSTARRTRRLKARLPPARPFAWVMMFPLWPFGPIIHDGGLPHRDRNPITARRFFRDAFAPLFVLGAQTAGADAGAAPMLVQIGTLIAATSLVQLANGFFNTFLSLRLTVEDFGPTGTGVVLSAYF